MNSDRRSFVQSLGLGTLGALAGGPFALSAAGPAGPPIASAPLPLFSSVPAEVFWRAVRGQFPLLDDPLYLNTGGLGPTSRPVLEAMFATMRKLQEHSETGHSRLEPARAVVARFVGAGTGEICFVRNATEGNSIVAAGLALKAGDEVIFETHAHPGGSFPWFNQVRQRGVVVRLFEPDPSGPEKNLQRIRELITPRTRVIQVSHITCTTGLVLPVAAVGELARARGIWFHVDGAQAVGMIPVDLGALGCDSYAFSGHKWLGAPHETGVLFIRRSRLEEVAPTGVGAYSGELPWLPGELTYSAAASRHEYGTRNAGAIEAVAEAVCFQESIGTERIAARGRELAHFLLVELARLPGITVLTPRHESLRASMTTLQHPRADASVFFTYLLEKHRLRCRPVTEQGLQAVRISTHLFTLQEDCERIVAAVKASIREL